MKLKEMEAFAALTDEERLKTIDLRKNELRAKAVEAYLDERFDPYRHTPDCGCGESYWTVNKEGQEALHVCFDSHGNIGSDVFEMVELSMLECLNCDGKPKAPQSFIEEYIEYIEREGGV